MKKILTASLFCFFISLISNAQVKLLDSVQLAKTTMYYLDNANEPLTAYNGKVLLKDEAGKTTEVKPVDVFRLTVNDKELTSFPTSILIFKNLQWLEIKYSSFAEIPTNITDLKKLQYLYIKDDTKLTELPETFHMLNSLKKADFAGCSIGKIPKEMETMKALKEINLSCTGTDCKITPKQQKSIRKKMPWCTIVF